MIEKQRRSRSTASAPGTRGSPACRAVAHPARRRELGARLQRIGSLPGETPAECAVLAMWARYLMDAGASAMEVGEAAAAAVRHPGAVEVKGPDSLWALNCAVALLAAERFDILESFLNRALSVASERGSAPASRSSARTLDDWPTGWAIPGRPRPKPARRSKAAVSAAFSASPPPAC